MIDSQTKQRIIDAANITEVVSDFVSLRRSGASYVGLCPFHSDRNPSFSVSPSRNICKCFVCGEGGSPLHFIMKHEQCSYNEALRYLAKKYHIEIVEREETSEEKAAASERASLLIVNEYAQGFFHSSLTETDEGRQIGLSYFRERGIRPETIEKFGLGYSPEEKDSFTRQAIDEGYALDRLIKVGLSVQYEGNRPAIDRFRGRVIFPVRNLSGQYVAFGGRVMSKTDKTAKYINSPESPIYSKSRELYGLYHAKQAITKAGKCYLVEGYTDVISMHQSGIENVVSSSGTALTQQQIRLLRRFSQNVTVLYDGDSAGIKAALRGIDLLLEEGLNIKVVLLPDGEDPDSYARTHSAEEFLTFLSAHETDFIHFKTQLYADEMQRDPIRRAELITDILHSIALIPDAIRRSVLIQSTAGDLNMDEQLLITEVNKLRAKGVRASGNSIGSSSASINDTPKPIPTEVIVPQIKEESTFIDDPHGKNSPFRYEIEILGHIIQYGNEVITLPTFDDLGNLTGQYDIALSQFVYNELEHDHLLSELSEVCLSVLKESCEICLPNGISSIDYFTNHESETIRRIATDHLSMDLRLQTDQAVKDADEKDLINRIKELNDHNQQTAAINELEAYRTQKSIKQRRERGNAIMRELDSLRLTILMEQIYQVQRELAEVQRSGDSEQILTLMKELSELNQIKLQFAQGLGERTIIG